MEIRSIGILKGVNNTYILTPVFKNNMHPLKIRITEKEYKKVKNNDYLIKELILKNI